MEFTGKIAGINVDWQTGRYAVTFTCNEPAAVKQNYDKFKDIEVLDIKAVKHRKSGHWMPMPISMFWLVRLQRC